MARRRDAQMGLDDVILEDTSLLDALLEEEAKQKEKVTKTADHKTAKNKVNMMLDEEGLDAAKNYRCGEFKISRDDVTEKEVKTKRTARRRYKWTKPKPRAKKAAA